MNMVAGALLLHIRGTRFQISARKPALLAEILLGFPQSLQVNAGIVL
jgi:hypothetical protein